MKNLSIQPMTIFAAFSFYALTVMTTSAGCTSPEEKASQIDTTVISNDTTATDTVTSTGSTSGDNSTGTDTTDMKRQKATRQAGNH
ncbi:hypothetical protein [Pedobacter sp. JY14-1]|uniref:hypothetical protein n=1 Tax=Pedobacter sp. JY14-1 TaxID=3034151 RepID=UPI0023E159D1|nr:hypothetical protein [Pedobacter sp. JY14-1]